MRGVSQGSNYPERNSDSHDEKSRQYSTNRAKRRRKLLLQKAVVIVVFVLAAALLVFCIVMIFQGISKSSKPSSSSSSSVVSQSDVVIESESQANAQAVATDPEAWNLQVISPAYPATADYPVPELTSLAYGGVAYYVDARIQEQLQQMIADCVASTENGSLRIISGYRSYAFSKKQYDHYYDNFISQGKTAEAAAAAAEQLEMYPGTNDHQTALAVAFVNDTVPSISDSFDQTAEYQWLRENSKNYGFVLRYPADKVDITGVAYQPYHFRYVGVDEAKEMTEKNLCLEEYVGKVPAVQAATEEAEVAPSAV